MEHTAVTPTNRIGGRGAPDSNCAASNRSILYLEQIGAAGAGAGSRRSNRPSSSATAASEGRSPTSSSSDPMLYSPPPHRVRASKADVADAAAAASAVHASANPRHSLQVPSEHPAGTRTVLDGLDCEQADKVLAKTSIANVVARQTSVRTVDASILPSAETGHLQQANSRRPSHWLLDHSSEVRPPSLSPIEGRPFSIIVDRTASEDDEQAAHGGSRREEDAGMVTPPRSSSSATTTSHSYTTSKYHKYNIQRQQRQQQQRQQQQQQDPGHPDNFAAGTMMSLAGGDGPEAWTSLLITDQRNSITQRNQAYASMAVVAALIAGISVTFLVEVNFDFTADSKKQTALLQVVVMGSMVVAFLSLYATMVLSSQYYLVTKALGGVTAMDVAEEGDALSTVNEFMRKTRTIRHLAVMAVVFTVPLFAILIAVYGIAKTGLDGIGYTSIALGGVALLIFLHAIISQQRAFTQPKARTFATLESINITKPYESPTSGVALETKGIQDAKRKEAKKMMQKFDNAVSTFKLFG